MILKKLHNLFLFFFFIFTTIAVSSQNTHEINFIITDTLVIGKNYPYATKVNVEINVRNFRDTLFLYNFNKYVSPSIFLNNLNSDRYKKNSMELTFVIEDKNNRIISPGYELVSYEKDKDITRISNSRIFVSSKQKIKYRKLNDEEQRNYDREKYKISSTKQNLELYLIFYYISGTSIAYHILPKGEYYLYLAYSNYYAPPSNEQIDVSKIFKGSVVSNKVKLIVE